MTKAVRAKGTPTLWYVGDASPPRGAHTALVPGAEAPVLPLDLPPKLKGAAREQVAKRQLVEQLSLPDGTFEFHPVVPKGTKNWSSAIVANADQIASWRKELGQGCQALLPDFMALPTAPDLWTLNAADGVVRVRVNATDGFTAETDLAIAQLAGLEQPKAILRLGEPDEALDDFLQEIGVAICRDAKSLRKVGVKLLTWTDAHLGANLREPPVAALQRMQQGLRRWRAFAVCGIVGVAIWLGSIWVDIQRLEAQAQSDGDAMRALVKEHFVTEGPILDVRAQVSAVMANVAAPVQLLEPTFDALTQLQIAAPLLTGDGRRMLAAAYRSDTGLTVSLEVADFALLDDMIADLQDAGFLVIQLDARTQSSGGVVSRLELELLE